MEKKGLVSLWIGIINLDDDLSEYVKLNYTEEGDGFSSRFMNDFNIQMDDFDGDFIESAHVTRLLCPR